MHSGTLSCILSEQAETLVAELSGCRPFPRWALQQVHDGPMEHAKLVPLLWRDAALLPRNKAPRVRQLIIYLRAHADIMLNSICRVSEKQCAWSWCSRGYRHHTGDWHIA